MFTYKKVYETLVKNYLGDASSMIFMNELFGITRDESKTVSKGEVKKALLAVNASDKKISSFMSDLTGEVVLEKNGYRFTMKPHTTPTYWACKTLRTIAINSMKKNDMGRAKAATELMKELNEKYNLGF